MTDGERALVALESADKYITKLEAENEKLREELEDEKAENGWAREFLNRMGRKCGTKDCPSLVAYVNKLESENEQLRELCRDLFGTAKAAAKLGIDVGKLQDYERRMKELGIEVDK